MLLPLTEKNLLPQETPGPCLRSCSAPRPGLSCLPLLTSCALKKPVIKNRTPIPMTVIIKQYVLFDLAEGGETE